MSVKGYQSRKNHNELMLHKTLTISKLYLRILVMSICLAVENLLLNRLRAQ
jgi:hypothetical protein